MRQGRIRHSRTYQYRTYNKRELLETYRYAIGTVAAILLCITALTIISMTLSSRAEQSRTTAEITDFPESYWEGLTAVREAIPNAVFVKFDTGITWDEMFTSDNLMYFSRQLVPNSANYPSSWKDTEYHSGSFDWVNNDWVVLSAPYWVQASEDAVAYYVDPRNFLNEQGIFMFEQQSFDASIHTLEGTDAVLVNTFMHSSGGNLIEVPAGALEIGETLTGSAVASTASSAAAGTDSEVTLQLTYAEVLFYVGKELNVSPYLLATRLRQEQGSGTSELISGTVKGYEGYYNYFNINASGETREEIVTNGMKEAVAEGWNSRYNAIYGGARKLVSNYVATGRDTLYLQKFNLIANKYGQIPYYGYMQNLLAPSSESTNVYNTYVTNDMLATGAFVFVIPVFNDMPEVACPKPAQDGNPNNRASALKVDDGTYSIGTFNMDTLSYSTVVPYASERVKISVSLYAKTSTVKINGTTAGSKGTTTRSGTVNLSEGNNKIIIAVTAENGDVRTYTITIRRQTAEEAQVSSAPKVSSGTYNISEKSETVSRIAAGTTAGSFLSGITVTNGSLQLVAADGTSISGDTAVATGMTLKVLNASKQEYQTYSVIVYGDTNGDGSITARDLLAVKRHILDIKLLDGNLLAAADVNNDGQVTARDMLVIKRDILGIASIEQR